MTQKQITTLVVGIIGILAGIFVPYKVGVWVSGNESCAVATWIVGLFTMVVVATGVGIGVIAYNFLRKN